MTATLPARRYVEHVLGMPISLALRGRHTDDTPALTRGGMDLADVPRAGSHDEPADPDPLFGDPDA